jgi:predicted Zn-dependent protease
LITSTAAVDLPNMGESSAAVISVQQEKELGEAFMREVRRSLTIIDDPQVQEYVSGIGYQLVANADTNTGDFTFFVVQHDAINAFAAPGGYIGIHTGLILTTRSESELASVVAHEIAHVTQRHLPRAFEQASQMNIPTAAALLAAIVLGRDNHNIGEAALAATFAANQQNRINFTRSNEQEADRIGIDLVARAQFDPNSMPTFFDRVQQTYRFYEGNLPEYLSTHPVTISRIADSRARAETYPPSPPARESSYPLIRAKLRVMAAKNTADATALFRADLDAQTQEARDEARYGYALALSAEGQHTAAREALAPLLKRDPERLLFLLARATIESSANEHQVAAKILKDTLALYPDNFSATMAYANTLLNIGQAGEAQTLLRILTQKRSRDPAVFKLYARAAGESGLEIPAHQALAEYYFLLGDTALAVQQLKVAQEKLGKDADKKNFYLASRVDARLKEIKAVLSSEDKRN